MPEKGTVAHDTSELSMEHKMVSPGESPSVDHTPQVSSEQLGREQQSSEEPGSILGISR